ncbi:hypothetical protein CC86DRAFT_66260 [Ophiobolus disseminans]|uniref:Secreted protein n=1 Tax=Ophiobolus disseminans TaxID=1469910 RepID=A0A6A6ZRD6_9PLEO|nr:hypothetical protein CC86DRAFT_66260 [Ophiobolus disseminans]
MGFFLVFQAACFHLLLASERKSMVLTTVCIAIPVFHEVLRRCRQLCRRSQHLLKSVADQPSATQHRTSLGIEDNHSGAHEATRRTWSSECRHAKNAYLGVSMCIIGSNLRLHQVKSPSGGLNCRDV